MYFLDCTLRDGGYCNAWDFSEELIHEYLEAMQAAGVDIVELGLRSLKNQGFQGLARLPLMSSSVVSLSRRG